MQVKKRNNYITIICGEKGTGKTTFALNLLEKTQKKTLIVDMIDHVAYRHIPVMPQRFLSAWKNGTYRFINLEPLSTLELINNTCWNANIILEDAHRFLNYNMSKNEIRIFYESKQHNFDLVIMFHALTQIPPDLYKITDKLVLFKTKDTFKSSTYNKFYNKTEIQKVHDRVMKNKSRYYAEVINL